MPDANGQSSSRLNISSNSFIRTAPLLESPGPWPLNISMAGQPDLLARKCVAYVIRAAHNGDLPLFATSLGMTPGEFLPLMQIHGRYELPLVSPEIFDRWRPAEFGPLAAMLLDYHGTDRALGRWLANAIASACYGAQHLWQDLGLENRRELSNLIAAWFPLLYAQNKTDLRWKRFLFGKLGERQGIPDLRAPECIHCDTFAACYSRIVST